MDKYIRIIGATAESMSHVDQLLSIAEFNNLIIEKLESNFNSPPLNVFLTFEAKRFRYAVLFLMNSELIFVLIFNICYL